MLFVKTIKFNFNYFIFFLFLFITEVIIALYVRNHFFRAYFGDVLVVILIYCFVLSFLKIDKIKTAFFVLLFSFAIEFAQYYNLIGFLGLQNYKLANVVMGNSYAFEDLICYVVGILVVLVIEKIVKTRKV